MNEKTNNGHLLQWHPAFYAGLQIEFEEEKDKLIFENEHHIGTKPKEIDVLIIKRNSTEEITITFVCSKYPKRFIKHLEHIFGCII